MASSKRTPAEIIDEARRERRLEEAADMGRVHIRLGEKPVTSKGRLWFRPKQVGGHVTEFNASETRAIYEALAIVQGQHRKRAEELESQVTVVEAPR